MSDPSAAASGSALEQEAAREVSDLSHADDSGRQQNKPRSLWSDAWGELRRKPSFVISGVLIALVVLMAVVPQLFTHTDPSYANLDMARKGPSASAWFGYDTQGRDIYARVIYGAKASLLVGLLSTLLTVLIGSLV